MSEKIGELTCYLSRVGLACLLLCMVAGCGGRRTAGASAVAPQDLPGDPKNGELLFKTFQPAAGIACINCHHVDSDERLVGPGLLHVGERAATRVSGQSAVEYLRTSILDPSAYVVEGYTDLMPKTWGQVFRAEEVDDLVAYLLSLPNQ